MLWPLKAQVQVKLGLIFEVVVGQWMTENIGSKINAVQN